MPSETSEIDNLSYEQARDQLVSVVSELENGHASLEDSLALWERGEALAKRCEDWLIGAKERLDRARSTTIDDPSLAAAALSPGDEDE